MNYLVVLTYIGDLKVKSTTISKIGLLKPIHDEYLNLGRLLLFSNADVITRFTFKSNSVIERSRRFTFFSSSLSLPMLQHKSKSFHLLNTYS